MAVHDGQIHLLIGSQCSIDEPLFIMLLPVFCLLGSFSTVSEPSYLAFLMPLSIRSDNSKGRELRLMPCVGLAVAVILTVVFLFEEGRVFLSRFRGLVVDHHIPEVKGILIGLPVYREINMLHFLRNPYANGRPSESRPICAFAVPVPFAPGIIIGVDIPIFIRHAFPGVIRHELPTLLIGLFFEAFIVFPRIIDGFLTGKADVRLHFQVLAVGSKQLIYVLLFSVKDRYRVMRHSLISVSCYVYSSSALHPIGGQARRPRECPLCLPPRGEENQSLHP